MDDLLKPKSIPLSKETVLWFEFLLSPNLLNSHLKKGRGDPSPIELLSQFIQMAPENQMIPQYDLTGVNNEHENNLSSSAASAADGLKLPRKSIALKVLTLKIATYIKWNLDIIENNLPIQKQMHLLKDLCTISFGKIINVPIAADFSAKPSPDGSDKASKFALTLYHRWVLRLQILKDVALKSCKQMLPNIPLPPEPPVHPFAPEIAPQLSVDYLKEIVTSTELFYVFTYETFNPVTGNSAKIAQNYDNMKLISLSEVRAQIYYDLVGYYLYSKKYKAAHDAVVKCRRCLNELKIEYKKKGLANKYIYCHIEDDELEGLLLACGVSEAPVKLTEKLNRSLLKQYNGIIHIFEEDNYQREIPLSIRRTIELDIEGAISRGTLKESKEFEMEVASHNVIRSIFEKQNIFANIDYFDKYKKYKCFLMILNGIREVYPFCDVNDMCKIKLFLIECIIKSNNRKQFIYQIKDLGIFGQKNLKRLIEKYIITESIMSPLATQTDWKVTSKITKIEIGNFERQLIACTNANGVRQFLVKLASTYPTKPLWTVNPSWLIPPQIHQIICSLQRGFVQDFSYILMGKAKEMVMKRDYAGATSILSVLRQEIQRPQLINPIIITKLGKLIQWEILSIQIHEAFSEWNKKSVAQALINKSKLCLNALQNNETLIPRMEIIENCTNLLLNCNEWSSIMFLEKKLPFVDLHVAFASTFLELEKLKGNKKVCRDAWDIVVGIFSIGGHKRNNSSRNSPGSQIPFSLYAFFKKIRDQLVFSLAISLLAKIHNILKDDTNIDINGEYMFLWPTNIINPIGYNIRMVSETLNWLLKQALKYYPLNSGWLKIKGDLELAIGNNESAIKSYVNSIITASEYCTVSLQRSIIDDYIIRRMIKTSTNLGHYIHSAILCQFMDDIDYALAFKNISEKTTNLDSMDTYYSCIWDSTLLEFIINHHHKKGEHSKKLEAVAIISQLELNSNNNEEIKRETATIRKVKFLRALAKQLLFK